MARALAVAGRDQTPEVVDVSVPNPGPGQIRVAVEAASVNGIDVATGAGAFWDSEPHRFPVVLGRDFAGTVERVGPGVATIRPRDRVAGVITGTSMARGTLTDTIVFDARSVTPLPPGISEEQAAARRPGRRHREGPGRRARPDRGRHRAGRRRDRRRRRVRRATGPGRRRHRVRHRPSRASRPSSSAASAPTRPSTTPTASPPRPGSPRSCTPPATPPRSPRCCRPAAGSRRPSAPTSSRSAARTSPSRR